MIRLNHAVFEHEQRGLDGVAFLRVLFLFDRSSYEVSTAIKMGQRKDNPILTFLSRQNPIILDGGLASELEARGCDLNSRLWSAGYLLMDPDAIRAVHLDYLSAGADCLISATYQATLTGFKRRGLSQEEARSLLRMAVDLAIEARERFLSKAPPDRQTPLVAASVGPYGAFLADGSEYSGSYDRDEDALYTFHRERFEILADSGADLLACETIPSRDETRALLRLLRENPGTWAWLSFSCRDGYHLWDGTELSEVAAEADRCDQVAAIGINCTAPRHISRLIRGIRKVTQKPIVVYPNSGEDYDVTMRHWVGNPDPGGFAARAVEWQEEGAALIGGCCRTTPEHIRQIRQLIKPRSPATVLQV